MHLLQSRLLHRLKESAEAIRLPCCGSSSWQYRCKVVHCRLQIPLLLRGFSEHLSRYHTTSALVANNEFS